MNIVIIGGSRGIGKAAARELLQDGNNVLIVGRNRRHWKRQGKNWPERQRIPVMPGRQRKPLDWWMQ